MIIMSKKSCHYSTKRNEHIQCECFRELEKSHIFGKHTFTQLCNFKKMFVMFILPSILIAPSIVTSK